MKLESFECNFVLSMSLQAEFDQLFGRNACYNNVWKAFTETDIFSKYPDLKIAYGYVRIYANFYARHCFLIENEEAVELTIKECEYKQYFAVMQFDIGEYMNALNQSRYTDLHNYRPLEMASQKFSRWATKNQIQLID